MVATQAYLPIIFILFFSFLFYRVGVSGAVLVCCPVKMHSRIRIFYDTPRLLRV